MKRQRASVCGERKKGKTVERERAMSVIGIVLVEGYTFSVFKVVYFNHAMLFAVSDGYFPDSLKCDRKCN